jgi:hypothetical protein
MPVGILPFLLLALIAFGIGGRVIGLVREASESRKWSDWLMVVITTAPLLLLALFFASAVILQGDALMGRIEDGHYYVTAKGQYTEVSRSAYVFSLWLGRAMIASFVLALTVSVLAGFWRRVEAFRRQTRD